VTRKNRLLAIAGLILSGSLNAQDLPFNYTEVSQLAEPWAMAFMPDGRLLVTERAGTLQLVDVSDGSKIEITGVPEVAYGNQSGFGEVALHPDYEDNGWIYFSYSEDVDGRNSTLTVFRAKLQLNGDSGELVDQETIWRQNPPINGGQYGMRIAFNDGYMYITVGDRMREEPAQDMSTNIGKIVRLHYDGSVPDDNPFADQGGVTAEIWSIGHRTPYGLAFDANGQLWETEMGPRGGDELNMIVRGDNYGWPEVSNGTEYSGEPIPNHDTRPEFHAPSVFWVPSVSPSSLMFYDGDEFPEWKGDALVGAMSVPAIIRIEFDGESATQAECYVLNNRVRGLIQGPDDAIWVIIDRGGNAGARGRGGFGGGPGRGGFGGGPGRGGPAAAATPQCGPGNIIVADAEDRPADGALLKLTAK
jgi:glucose/arabinose dehydrogenase